VRLSITLATSMSQQKTRRANDMQMKRQTRRQKEAFRREVLEAFPNAYTDRHLLAKNIVIGNPV